MKKIFLTLIISLSLAGTTYSQEWEHFGTGVDNRVNALTVYGNELIAGGWFTITGGKDICRVGRWTGTTWTPLGSMSNLITSLCAYESGLYSGSNVGILRWNGTEWLSPGGGVDNSVNALTVYNNELIAAGDFTTAGTTNANRIAKWNGSVWTPLGSGLNGTVYALTVYNNELIAGGNFTVAGSSIASKIAKWNGTSWSSLASGLNDTVFALAVYNGSLIAGGSFTTAGGSVASKIAKWNGTIWTTLGSGITGVSVYALTVFNDQLIAGGNFTLAGNTSANYIAKWNGTVWSALGIGMGGQNNPAVRSFTVFNYGLIAGGDFVTAGGVTVNRIAKWKTYFTVSGYARYADNNQPATNGSVKAVKVDRNTGIIIVYDSTQINPDGSYTLTKVPQDSVDIGVYPNSSTQNDWVMTYYPSTIYWQNAATLYPTGNLTNINIGVYRLFAVTSINSVNGRVRSVNPSGNLKDAVLYAKIGNSFVRCASSDADGVYHLVSLPTGIVKIIVNRMGYSGDSTNVTLTSTSNIDSVNFALNRITIGIRQLEGAVPSDYMLYQNYPNPFNPATNIRYQIANNKLVTLKIYDLLGKEIATLVNEKQSIGVYEVTFDAGSLTSGVYFYKLTVGDFVETRKMLIIK